MAMQYNTARPAAFRALAEMLAANKAMGQVHRDIRSTGRPRYGLAGTNEQPREYDYGSYSSSGFGRGRGGGGGGGGGFGFVNDIRNAAADAWHGTTEALAIPGRGVRSFAKELGDAMDQLAGDPVAKAEGQSASFGDFFKQLSKENAVSGTELLQSVGLSPNNPIAKGAAGFALETLWDPIMYLAPAKVLQGGAKAVEARLATQGVENVAKSLVGKSTAEAATKATGEMGFLTKNLPKATVDKIVESAGRTYARTTAEAIVKPVRARVLVKGASDMTKAETELMLGTTGGLKFAGRTLLPKGLAEKPARAIAGATRGLSRNTKLGKLVSDHLSGLNPALRNDLHNVETAVVANEALKTVNVARASALNHAGQMEHEFEQLVRPVAKKGMTRDLVKAIEGDVAAEERLVAAGFDIEPFHAQLRSVFEQLKDAGVDINEVEKYFPRRVIGGRTEHVLDRRYTPGAVIKGAGGEDITLKGTPAAIRQVVDDAAKAVGEPSFYEQNPLAVMPQYFREMGKKIAQGRAVQALEQKGLLTPSTAAQAGKAAKRQSKGFFKALDTIAAARVERQTARTAVATAEATFKETAPAKFGSIHTLTEFKSVTDNAVESAADAAVVATKRTVALEKEAGVIEKKLVGIESKRATIERNRVKLSPNAKKARAKLDTAESELNQAKAIVDESKVALEKSKLDAQQAGGAANLELVQQQEIAQTIRDIEVSYHTALAEEAEAGRKILSAQETADKMLKGGDKFVNKQTQAIRDQAKAIIPGFDKFAADPEVASALAQIGKATTPKAFKRTLREYDKLQRFLKAWQVTSPGFHVRNFIGAFFNNVLAGVTMKSYFEVVPIWNAHRKMMAGDATKWLTYSAEKRKTFGEIFDVVGRGRWSQIEIGGGDALRSGYAGPLSPKRLNVLKTSNIFTDTSRAAGGHIEGLMRGALAWEVMAKRGQGIEDAVLAINRYHFDYSDLSEFETRVKRIIPFYVWTRRNFPLQVENIFTQPQKYAWYNHAKDALGDVADHMPDDPITSRIVNDSGRATKLPFKLGGGFLYANPELPFTKTMTDPLEAGGIESMITPVIKTPVELLMKKRAYKGIPLRSTADPAPGGALWGPLMPFLAAVGAAHKDENGNYTMEDRWSYLVEQAFPFMQDARRLQPTESRYEQRRWASWASQFGLPIRGNTTYEQEVERKRLERENR